MRKSRLCHNGRGGRSFIVPPMGTSLPLTITILLREELLFPEAILERGPRSRPGRRERTLWAGLPTMERSPAHIPQNACCFLSKWIQPLGEGLPLAFYLNYFTSNCSKREGNHRNTACFSPVKKVKEYLLNRPIYNHFLTCSLPIIISFLPTLVMFGYQINCLPTKIPRITREMREVVTDEMSVLRSRQA